MAKSILILIPIFGLHFIIFAWFPYVKFDDNLNFEVGTLYLETFFNSFQVRTFMLFLIKIQIKLIK